MLKKPTPFLQQKKRALIFACLLCCSLFSFAQQMITVTGNVSAENNVPLPGVSVNVKGSSAGTITDAAGKFSIRVNEGTTLVFSFVGYEENQVVVNSEKSAAHIQMVATSSTLNDVVVVGYGTQKKTTLTGAVVAVNGDELQKSAAPNVSNSLVGRLPGLVVVTRTGEPGTDAS
jgi:hypothetical protein